MTLPWKPFVVSAVGVLALAGVALALSPSEADAQCGSQASSCKNCHEIQAEDPVNTKGDWHTAHAFGDFCEFCHAGNVQAADADAAHQGMVDPLADPQASCSACHPNDAFDLAVVYGTALGVNVGTGATGASAPDVAPTGAPTPTAAAPAPTDLSAPGLIDFNTQYAETVEGKTSANVGNIILGVVIAAMVLGGGGYVVWRERRRRIPAAAAAEVPSPAVSPAPPAASPQAEALTVAVGALDPLGRRALERLLRDPQTASDLLRRLSRLDPEMIRTVRGLDRETRALLLALTSD